MLDAGEVVVQWSGVRGDESSKRAGYERFSTDQRGPEFLYNFLPIHQWTAADVFALHKYFGIAPNPLYTLWRCARRLHELCAVQQRRNFRNRRPLA
ncbi:phosphoadenosine phosphosulfate reductase family protein [Escherichia coli]|nr:phosphoadenosine phosphosulfate reductase family protein [Escherichia coli]